MSQDTERERLILAAFPKSPAWRCQASPGEPCTGFSLGPVGPPARSPQADTPPPLSCPLPCLCGECESFGNRTSTQQAPAAKLMILATANHLRIALFPMLGEECKGAAEGQGTPVCLLTADNRWVGKSRGGTWTTKGSFTWVCACLSCLRVRWTVVPEMKWAEHGVGH